MSQDDKYLPHAEDAVLFHDVHAAEKVMSREVTRWRPQDIHPNGRVAAIERGVMLPDGTTTYERIEFAD